MNSHAKSLYIVASVSSSCEIWQVELNLIPALVESHRHCADEWLHSCCRLIIWGSKSSSDIFVVQNLHFESEIFLELNEEICTFLMIITRKGSLMPRVSWGFWGQVMKAVVTLVPIISSTEDWMSWSVILLMWPLWTMIRNDLLYFSQIWSGLLPILYKMDKNPDW